jgi:hypothetical protein
METQKHVYEKPRYYSDVNIRRGLAYSEYENIEFDYE